MSIEVKENELANLEVRTENISINNDEQTNKKNCCCLCRFVKWFFAPLFSQIKYSLAVLLYSIVTYVITWLGFGLEIMVAVSIALFVAFCAGMITYYIACEMLLTLARYDLKFAIKMVENDEGLKKRSQYLQTTLNFAMPSRTMLCNRSCCPCVTVPSQDAKYRTMSCCSLLYERITTIITRWRMYSIIIYYLIVKPFVTLITSFMVLIIAYCLFTLFTPIIYLSYSKIYTSGQLCAFGGSSCNDNGNNCHCYGLLVENFGTAFGVGLIGFLMLPISFRLNNFAGQLSKVITYYFLTSYYQDADDGQSQQLLYTNNV